MTKDKNVKIEIDTKTIQKISSLCELSGLETPDVINNDFIERAYTRIKDLLINLKKQTDQGKNKQEEDLKQLEKYKTDIDDLKKQLGKALNTPQEPAAETPKEKKSEPVAIKPKKQENEDENEEYRPKNLPSSIDNILVIANIGVIMHQLKVLFKKFGCKINSVKNYAEAIKELKQQEYNCILFDIQTITDHDLMLIEALRKATEICHTDTTIVILTLPLKDKKTFKQIRSKGADIIIEKNESWHMNILKELKIINE